MTEMLTKAFAELSKLPPDRQDELAPFLMALADHAPLSADEAQVLTDARAENARSGLAPAEAVRAFWSSLSL